MSGSQTHLLDGCAALALSAPSAHHCEYGFTAPRGMAEGSAAFGSGRVQAEGWVGGHASVPCGTKACLAGPRVIRSRVKQRPAGTRRGLHSAAGRRGTGSTASEIEPLWDLMHCQPLMHCLYVQWVAIMASSGAPRGHRLHHICLQPIATTLATVCRLSQGCSLMAQRGSHHSASWAHHGATALSAWQTRGRHQRHGRP